MEYRTLGRTGLKVSVLGFGGAPIGIPKYLGAEDRADPRFHETAIESIRLAVERGINYFDTAPAYGKGASEDLFGRALEPSRGRIVLATKYLPDTAEMRFEQRTDALRASLQRLRTDHVDLLQLHGAWWDEPRMQCVLQSDLLDWADEMRARNLIRFTGITAEGPSHELDQLLAMGRFDVLQIAYSVIYQACCDFQREPRGVIPMARGLGMGIVTMRTATSGVLQKLLRTEFPEIDARRVSRLAINFVLSTPQVDCAIVGMKTPAEVAANVALADDASKRIDLRKIHDRFDADAR